MFSFYGSKSKLAHLYPEPTCDTLIEPFAGSARYALLHWKKNVILTDLDPVIISVWQWLQKSSIADIMLLPNMQAGEHVDDYKFACQEAKWLVGFMINQGSAVPKKTVSKTGGFGNMVAEKNRIALNLHKIKHWHIRCKSYEQLYDMHGTWFIDPPYQKKGIYYRKSSKQIDYERLGTWCKNRKGQVIVCENEGADWLPFSRLAVTKGSIRKSTEVVWINEG